MNIIKYNTYMETIYHFYVLSSTDSPDKIRYVGVTMQTVEQRFYKHKYCATHLEKRGLPVHGQSTRRNARTRKGKPKTIANKKK